MGKFTTDVLLATFNGAAYLQQLMRTLCDQTYKDFRILTSDDASTDDTRKIVDGYRDRLRIQRIESTAGPRLGALKNFEFLMNTSSADYVFFCDQDDEWNPRKIEKQVQVLQEKLDSGLTNIAVFSDLEIIDENSRCLRPSLLEYRNFNLSLIKDRYYLVYRNPAPGCSLAVTRELLLRALPIAPGAIMHDWWLVLLANRFGELHCIREPLVRYRIHGNNTIGVEEEVPKSIGKVLASNASRTSLRHIIQVNQLLIVQGRAAFGHTFSERRYWVKLLMGRAILPMIARFNPKLKPALWR